MQALWKSIWQFVCDLFGKPRYASHPSYLQWQDAAEKVTGDLNKEQAAEAVEYAWKAYEESRDLHFRSESKRDEFLKFTSGLIAFLGVALGTGRLNWNTWLAATLILEISAAGLLIWSRRSIALPGLPDLTDIRVHLRLGSAKEEWMARNLGQVREALLTLQMIRGRQLDVSLSLLAAGLVCLAIWAFTSNPTLPPAQLPSPAPAIAPTSSSADS